MKGINKKICSNLALPRVFVGVSGCFGFLLRGLGLRV